jgi:hypothetical protein
VLARIGSRSEVDDPAGGWTPFSEQEGAVDDRAGHVPGGVETGAQRRTSVSTIRYPVREKSCAINHQQVQASTLSNGGDDHLIDDRLLGDVRATHLYVGSQLPACLTHRDPKWSDRFCCACYQDRGSLQ